MATKHVPESSIQSRVVELMRKLGWEALRTEYAFIPGRAPIGDPAMPDYQFRRPITVDGKPTGKQWVLWIEFKSPTASMACRCGPDAKGKPRTCRLCKQAAWKREAIARGELVWTIDSARDFAALYLQSFQQLHPENSMAIALLRAESGNV